MGTPPRKNQIDRNDTRLVCLYCGKEAQPARKGAGYARCRCEHAFTLGTKLVFAWRYELVKGVKVERRDWQVDQLTHDDAIRRKASRGKDLHRVDSL